MATYSKVVQIKHTNDQKALQDYLNEHHIEYLVTDSFISLSMLSHSRLRVSPEKGRSPFDFAMEFIRREDMSGQVMPHKILSEEDSFGINWSDSILYNNLCEPRPPIYGPKYSGERENLVSGMGRVAYYVKKQGENHFGNPIPLESARAWVEKLNREHPDLHHYVAEATP